MPTLIDINIGYDIDAPIFKPQIDYTLLWNGSTPNKHYTIDSQNNLIELPQVKPSRAAEPLPIRLP